VISGGAADASLQRELDALALLGLLLGHRVISPGDEHALLGPEAASIASPVIERRRASGAARIVARALLAQLGFPDVAVPKGTSGEPLWPSGVTGSLAHDDEVAVAAVGWQREVGSVGIDVEPAAPLDADMLDLIATPQERARISGDPLYGKLLFAAKEAVYKAAFPLDRVFLEFRDIEVDLAGRSAATRTGRTVTLRYVVAPRVVVLALA
jgi:4'-phosphopantetheinyl transferase EntD